MLRPSAPTPSRLLQRLRAVRPEAWDRAFAVLLAIALLAPLGVSQHPGPRGARVTLPAIFGEGVDEEAYLILLNSVLHDGDLDLKADHARILAGGLDGGRKAAGRRLDHHSSYWIDGKRHVWRELVDLDTRKWTRGEGGLLFPVFRPDVDPALAAGPEYSAHPVGIALLLYPFLWPLRGRPDLVEPAALLCAGLATVAAMLLLRRLLRVFTSDLWIRNVVLVAAFLGSPVWFHGRTFFNEPFLVALALAAVVLALRPRGAFAAGACVAAGMLMKPTLALLLPCLALPALQRRQWRQLLWLGALPAAALGLLLWLNARMYGSPFQGPFEAEYGNPLVALYHFLVVKDRGLVWFAPPLLAGALGFSTLWRRQRLETAVVLGSFAALFGLMLFWRHFTGGWCYGPRLIVPSLPLLAVGLVGVLEARWFRASFLPRFIFYDALLYAVLTNGQAAFRYWVTMSWTEPWKIFGDFLGVCLR